MKLILMILTTLVFFISANSYSATLNLEGGESATIQPNVATTVTCGSGGSSNCQSKLDGLGTLLGICRSDGGNWGNCFKDVMSKWNRANPGCVTEATILCVKKCGSSGCLKAYCQ